MPYPPMSNVDSNPYAAPASDSPPPAVHAATDAAALVRRWEKWRLMYNLIVGLTGLLSTMPLLSSPAFGQFADSIVTGIVEYGIAANVAYFIGPLAELYLIWLAHDTAGWLSARMRAAMSSPSVGPLLFVLGTLFAVLITLAIGLMVSFSVMLPNQF